MMQEPDSRRAFRPSGVRWLGVIPAHWRVLRLKQCARLIMGQSPPGHLCGPLPGRPFLQGCAEFGPRSPVPVWSCERPLKVAPRGSLLLSVRAPVGRLNWADQEYGIGRGLCAIVPHGDRLLADFAYYQLGALQEGLLSSATGSTYDAVTVGDLEKHTVVLPPLSEQGRIVDWLNRENADIIAAISGVRREVELLQEYRTRLISEVVTGKVDVREAAEQLPGPGGEDG